MTNFIGNAFSLAMLNNPNVNIKITNIHFEEMPRKDYISCIGHENISNLFNLEYNRVNISLTNDDVLYVIQQNRGRNTDFESLTKDDFVFYKVEIFED